MKTAASTSHSIEATDGYALGARRFAAEAPRATVIIAGASATPQSYYRHFASHLAGQANLETLTFDYRGMGASRPPSLRGFEASMRQWGEADLEGVIAWARARAPRRPLLLVGHSAGGQLLGLAPGAAALDGIYLVAASSGYYGLWDGWEQLVIRSAFHVIPALTHLWGYLPYGMFGGQDLPRGVALQWSAWGRHPDYIRSAPGVDFERIKAPLQALSFSDDLFASKRAVAALVSWYVNSRGAEHRPITPRQAGLRAIGHFGFFRPWAAGALWPDAVRWLEARLA